MANTINCPVCRAAAGDVVALCRSCETPHHPECWLFTPGCAVFACGENRARLLTLDQLETGQGLESAEILVADERPAAADLDATGFDDTTFDDTTFENRGFEDELGVDEAPPEPLRIPPRRNESPSVLAVSWVYLAASLVLAIPALGYLVGGLTGGGASLLGRAGVSALIALGLKTCGDLLAIGDRRGRTAHLYVCLMLAAASVSLLLTACLGCLAAPFLTRRGVQHFARSHD